MCAGGGSDLSTGPSLALIWWGDVCGPQAAWARFAESIGWRLLKKRRACRAGGAPKAGGQTNRAHGWPTNEVELVGAPRQAQGPRPRRGA